MAMDGSRSNTPNSIPGEVSRIYMTSLLHRFVFTEPSVTLLSEIGKAQRKGIEMIISLCMADPEVLKEVKTRVV